MINASKYAMDIESVRERTRSIARKEKSHRTDLQTTGTRRQALWEAGLLEMMAESDRLMIVPSNLNSR
ncbi:hypothetical protein TIFTF001_023439 [Ficus carica]|uniref:Uncharacterized protein n=1 Tax=Ficus carica TaxID=3494 RepID=A0AA88AG66_FICCA|nr:hypothetical protein TIFTF001_023439 [Ficus carica]